MKPQSLVRSYFKKKEVLGKDVQVCQFCDLQYQTINATRMKQHLLKCKNCPQEVKDSFDTAAAGAHKNHGVHDLTIIRSDSDATSSTNVHQATSPSDDETISSAIAQAVYVTGSPLSMLEHPLWKNAIYHLNPNYKPPSRKRMSTVLLDTEYNKTKSHIGSVISDAKVLHLATDGWSNVRNEGILNIVIFTPKPFFYSFVDTKAHRHTSEYLMSEIAKVIDELNPEKFMGIITDNAANMKRCGKLLEQKYPNIMWSGCLAHTLHLHVSDILKIKSLSKLVQKIVKIIKSIKKSQIVSAIYKQIATEKSINVSLHLPVKTRWASYSHCLDTFLVSKVILQNIVVNINDANLPITRHHKVMILDEDFWLKTEKLRDILKPITAWITFLEGDYCSVHKVHQCFLEINKIFDESERINDIIDNSELTVLQNNFQGRKESALKPIHYAACILDPSNKGQSLSSNEHIDGCEVIMKLSELMNSLNVSEVFMELSQYKNQEGLWSKQFINNMAKKMAPTAWWDSFFGQTRLGQIAKKILTVPSTSAAVERSFSTFSHIHTNKRNKLTTDRAGKISYVSHNWRLLTTSHKTAKDICNNSTEIQNTLETDDNSNIETCSSSDSDLGFLYCSASESSDKIDSDLE